MTATSWAELIESLEDELNRHEAALRTGELTPVPEFSPPADCGPMPEALRQRVTDLISRIQLLSTFVQFQLAATEGDLRHLQRTSSPNSAVALFLDSSV